MEDQILEHLLSVLEGERQKISESLGDGAAKDYASYKEMCGVSRGLLIAQSEINNLLQKMKDEDD